MADRPVDPEQLALFGDVEYPDPNTMYVVADVDHLPTKTYPDDAGFDLYVHERVTIPSQQFRDVAMGCRVQLPPNHWGMLIGRSSTIRARRLLVYMGVIDHGWRGPLFAGVYNLGDTAHTLEPGDRIAQLIVVPVPQLTQCRTTRLDPHPRGHNGFGSSGR